MDERQGKRMGEVGLLVGGCWLMLGGRPGEALDVKFGERCCMRVLVRGLVRGWRFGELFSSLS